MGFATTLKPTERERLKQNRNALICSAICQLALLSGLAGLLAWLFGR